MAEIVFRKNVADAGLSDRIEIASAGTGDWHVGESAYPTAQRVLTDRGYDGSQHRARKFARGWFDDYDLLVAMDRMNVKVLQQLARKPEDADKIGLLRMYDSESVTYGELDVPDPFDAPYEVFAEVLRIIEAGCRGLLASVRPMLES
jgi:protein-tyrosine phosphatase